MTAIGHPAEGGQVVIERSYEPDDDAIAETVRILLSDEDEQEGAAA
ncbi:MAG: hypothetical protein M3O91_03565 [Chloroflexota bacterium]|nr:hypothetical protein [Chloroflexota bacterium]